VVERQYDYVDVRGDRWVLHAGIVQWREHVTVFAADTVEDVAMMGVSSPRQATYSYYDNFHYEEPRFQAVPFEKLAYRIDQDESFSPSTETPVGPAWKVSLYVRERYAVPVAVVTQTKWRANNCWLSAASMFMSAMNPWFLSHRRARELEPGTAIRMADRDGAIIHPLTLLAINTKDPLRVDEWEATTWDGVGTMAVEGPFTVPDMMPEPTKSKKGKSKLSRKKKK
jgi:hypothetical protein